MAWVMDEASAFTTLGGKDNALACYGTLQSSAMSRFPAMHWIGLIISFPRRQEGDFTLDKFNEVKDDPKMYGDRGATWEVNPQYDPQHPLFKDFPWVWIDEINGRVPEPFEKAFKSDAMDSKTKYMCEPPPQAGGFFELPNKIEEAVNNDLPVIVATKNINNVLLTVKNHLTGQEEELLKQYVQMNVEQLPPRKDGCTYYMHGDPGLVNDFFAVCVCHTVPESKTITDADGRERDLKKVVVDFCITWEPRANVRVDMGNVAETMLKFARYYGIRHVTFDKWNSADMVQMFNKAGIMAEDLSFSNAQQFAMYRNLKLLLYNDLIQFPPDSKDFRKELTFLKVENNKITHDVYGKDRADAVAGATWLATGKALSEVGKLIAETLGETFNRHERQQAQYSVVPFRF